MVLFFLLVSLEVKRELLIGELNTVSRAALPLIAAFGGMLLPAVIYFTINSHNAIAMRGWAIPTATDIAFSLAILLMLRSYVPPYLKVFLTALAIIDDLGAILIIAVFYTHNFAILYFGLALICILVLLTLNWLNITRYVPYFIIAIVLWWSMLNSGIHTTIAGVILGFVIPLKTSNENFSPSKKLEHALQPWVSYAILPLFAFANTGVSFSTLNQADFIHSVTVGIILGLFFGKQLGVFLACWVGIKLGFARLPANINWYHIYGVSALCGIGFTMSLFIGNLAFNQYHLALQQNVKIGVLIASVLSGITGALILWANARSKYKPQK